MTAILDGLYLGNIDDAFSSKLTMHPTAVINCAKELPMSPYAVAYMKLDLADSTRERILPHFADTNDFIDAQLKMGRRVLVHCAAGISRSATIVIGYIMYRHKMPFKDAYAYVKEKRNVINPNFGFTCQLYTYSEHLGLSV